MAPSTGRKESKSNKTAMCLCLFAGLLWIIVGLRDTFAPGFFTRAPRVLTKLDIIVDFAAGTIFLIAAAGFRKNNRVAAKPST